MAVTLWNSYIHWMTHTKIALILSDSFLRINTLGPRPESSSWFETAYQKVELGTNGLNTRNSGNTWLRVIRVILYIHNYYVLEIIFDFFSINLKFYDV